MKLLVLTQKVDLDDPVLGFFHTWIEKLAHKFEQVTVVCLQKGRFDLPDNVKVLSLGKETKRSKFRYALTFWKYIWIERNNYDAVFVHMNQEYVLLGGVFWKLFNKKLFFWRNHPKGNFFTYIAAILSNRIFCTSPFSFTARFKRTILMPVGIDTSNFKNEVRDGEIEPHNSILATRILFLGRMSPIKRPNLLLDALKILSDKGAEFTADFYGDPLPKDASFYELLRQSAKELGLENKVKFYVGVSKSKTSNIFHSHGIFVNLTPTGSMDKTILEAALCGCIPIVANQSFRRDFDDKMIVSDSPDDIAEKISFWLTAPDSLKSKFQQKLSKYVLENHSLNVLIEKLVAEINK